jgi:hypothetical protein
MLHGFDCNVNRWRIDDRLEEDAVIDRAMDQRRKQDVMQHNITGLVLAISHRTLSNIGGSGPLTRREAAIGQHILSHPLAAAV